jgi:hypothetical protein
MTKQKHYLQKKLKDLRNIEYIVRSQHSIQIDCSTSLKINFSQTIKL